METEVTTVQSLAPAKPEVASVDGFIAQAIASSLPVETMERLFALRKEVKAEQAREAYTAAMAKFQSQCGVIEKKKIVKDKSGKERYRYAQIDDIDDQTRAARTSNGFSFKTDVVHEPGFITAVVIVTHELGHTEPSSFRVPIDTDSYMSAPQRVAAALTFAKRYAFCNAFGILTGDEDTDAAPEEQEVRTPPRVAAPAPRPAPRQIAIDPAVLEHHRQVLQATTSVEDLAAAWSETPKHLRKTLEGTKDEMKAKLSY